MQAGSGPAVRRSSMARAGRGPCTALMERLATDFTVMLPEHPGFGGGDAAAWLDRCPDLANFYPTISTGSIWARPSGRASARRLDRG